MLLCRGACPGNPFWNLVASSSTARAAQERERYEEAAAAKERAARLQASNTELRSRVDELSDEAQRLRQVPHVCFHVSALPPHTTAHALVH